MIVANIKLLNGERITEYAKDHIELFSRLDAAQIDEIKTKSIRLRDMRQGKEKRMEEPEK